MGKASRQIALPTSANDIQQGPVPWAMPSEVFPSTLRAKGVA
jgi:hypothetical protein